MPARSGSRGAAAARARRLAGRVRVHAADSLVPLGRSLRVLPSEPAPTGRASFRDVPEVRFIELEPSAPPAPTDAHTLGEPHPIFDDPGGREPYPAYIIELPAGRLLADGGVVVTAGGDAIEETAWDRKQLEAMLGASRLIPRRRHLGGTHASLISQWHSNYFHWILEVLPRYAQLERAGLAHLPLVVPARLGRPHSDSLALLGIPSRQLVPYRPQHVQSDVLVWPTPAGHTGHSPPWACTWLRRRFAPEPSQARRRIYLTRDRAPSRRIVRERGLVSALRRLGFETVRPESLTFAEQVAVFAAAEMVVAPHGAGLTNLVFATEATLVELFEPGYLNPCYRALARSCGHRYWYVVGSGVDGDIDVDPELVAATVEAATA
jgi:Glycosyltransferase 61